MKVCLFSAQITSAPKTTLACQTHNIKKHKSWYCKITKIKDPLLARRLLREVKLMQHFGRSLNANIVALHELYWLENRVVLFVLEYVDRGVSGCVCASVRVLRVFCLTFKAHSSSYLSFCVPYSLSLCVTSIVRFESDFL